MVLISKKTVLPKRFQIILVRIWIQRFQYRKAALVKANGLILLLSGHCQQPTGKAVLKARNAEFLLLGQLPNQVSLRAERTQQMQGANGKLSHKGEQHNQSVDMTARSDGDHWYLLTHFRKSGNGFRLLA